MISDKLKKHIIDLYCNTKLKPYDLYEIISIENDITDNEFYEFLNNYKTKDGKPLQKDFDIINKKIDDCIYTLKLKGYNYSQISAELKKQFIELSDASVYTRCKQIFEDKGEEMPKTKNKKESLVNKDKKHKKSKKQLVKKAPAQSCNKVRNKQSLINEEELYRLRKSGCSLHKITEHYKSVGVDISYETIRIMCDKIFKQKGEKEPKHEKLGYRYDEAVYIIRLLREQGLAYASIKDELDKNSIVMSVGKIKRICDELNKDTNNKPKYKSKTKRNVSDEEIYRLRKEQGLSLHETTEHFQKQGIIVSYSYIAAASKRIFDERGEKSPQSKSRRTKELKNWDDELYALRRQGLSFSSIKSYFDDKGLKLGIKTIRNRCEEVFNEKGEVMPGITSKNREFKIKGKNSQCNNKIGKVNKNVIEKESLLDVVLKIKEKKQATEEQMNKFVKEVSKMYKIDLEQDIKNIYETER